VSAENPSMGRMLFIIRGVQGSGKSTLAEMIKYSEGCKVSSIEGDNWLHFEADMFFKNPISGEYEFDATKLPAAHRWCEYNVNKAMEEGRNVIVSNTFTKKSEYQVYLEMGEKHGYQIQEIICKGRFQNVHGVPEEKVEAKRKAFEY
jgi:predicted kinase